MALYSRRQLLVLLLVLAAAGLGLAVQRWRHAYPELAERVEQFDREPPRTADAQGRADAGTAAADRPRPLPSRTTRAAHDRDGPLDLNRATIAELSRLPGVGPVLAARIVAAREAGGVFASVDDLRRVRGLGSARLDRLRPLVAVAGAPAPPAPP